MSFSRQQYENAAQQFFRQNPQIFEKYFSPTLLQTVVGTMSLPSVTAAMIALDRLVAKGTIQRTDGRTDRDDAVEAVATAEANFNRVVAEVDSRPLMRSELEYFASLSNRDLADKYWADDGHNEFRVRYDRAVREHLFQAPARPRVEAPDNGAEITLTPEEYRAMPSAELQRRLREPRFKLAVMQLIRDRRI